MWIINLTIKREYLHITSKDALCLANRSRNHWGNVSVSTCCFVCVAGCGCLRSSYPSKSVTAWCACTNSTWRSSHVTDPSCASTAWPHWGNTCSAWANTRCSWRPEISLQVAAWLKLSFDRHMCDKGWVGFGIGIVHEPLRPGDSAAGYQTLI